MSNVLNEYNINPKKIVDIVVNMDDDVPDYMGGVERISSVDITFINDEDEEEFIQIDDYANTEFFEGDSVSRFIKNEFGIEPSDVVR